MYSASKLFEEIFKTKDRFLVIAGPCAVEDLDQMISVATEMVSLGVPVLRGEIFKPRTNPDSFQGVGDEGLEILRKTKERTGIKVVTEVMDSDDLENVMEVADIIQIGSRNCQNFSLLKKVGRIDKPVLLKRGFGNTVEEFVHSSRYISNQGNDRIILVERGIRTFENSLRFTLDVGSVPILKEQVKHPILVDPSHPAGESRFVEPLALASAAAGADGLMVEVHPTPDIAKSDSRQQLNYAQFRQLMHKLKMLMPVMGKSIIGQEIRERA